MSFISHTINNIFKSLAPQLQLEGLQWKARTSIGVTFIDSADDTAENALKRADMAMYGAKEGGRNQHRIYTDVASHGQGQCNYAACDSFVLQDVGWPGHEVISGSQHLQRSQ